MWTRANPSPLYERTLAEARVVHAKGKLYHGKRTFKATPWLEDLCRRHKAKTLLDYGCGRGLQYQERDFDLKVFNDKLEVVTRRVPSLVEGLGVKEIYGYDPAVEEFDTAPVGRRFDGVYSVDVLPAIPEDDLPWAIAFASSFATKFFYVSFKLSLPRPKKSTTVQSVPEERWLELLNANVPRNIEFVARIRGTDAICRYHKRLPDGAFRPA
jgi:hypothetical protein